MLGVIAMAAETYLRFVAVYTDSFGVSLPARRWFALYTNLNSLGCRDKEWSVARSSGVRRIAFVGDSFTYGWGIERVEDRFVDLIQAEFDRRRTELLDARVELSARVAALPRLSVVPGDGNFVLVDVSATQYTAEQLVEALLHEGVLIRSLGVHHANRSYVRITVGTREQNLRCVQAFERVLARKKGSVRYAISGASDAE